MAKAEHCPLAASTELRGKRSCSEAMAMPSLQRLLTKVFSMGILETFCDVHCPQDNVLISGKALIPFYLMAEMFLKKVT